MSRGQYELLTEALGLGLSDVRRRHSPMLEDAAWTVIHRLSETLKDDNQNFNEKQFIEGVDSVARLDVVVKKGITIL